jgi:hypothetical protein
MHDEILKNFHFLPFGNANGTHSVILTPVMETVRETEQRIHRAIQKPSQYPETILPNIPILYLHLVSRHYPQSGQNSNKLFFGNDRSAILTMQNMTGN